MLVIFFTQNPNLKKNWGSGARWGAGVGDRCVWDGTDGWTYEQAKPICPFNFFEVGGITMHKRTSYVPDKLN